MRRPLAQLTLAVAATAAAALLRALLSRWVGADLPYITFFGAVMAAGWYGGLWPGLIATVLGALATVVWFIAPAHALAVGDAIGVVVFVLTGALISLGCERLDAARRQLEARTRADLDERQDADRARSLLAAIVESSEDAIFTKGLDGRILSWNAGAEHMFGYTAAEAVGGPVARLVPPHRHAEEADLLRRVSRGERVPPVETERLARDGTLLDVSVTLSPLRDDTGRIVGASSIARDIGARKALEASLREADRRKDDFLAVLAHELRNPLAPIRTSVALLQDADLPPAAAARAIGVIDRQTRHISRLLDDLLDISRITRDRLELRREPVTLQDVLDTAVETTAGLFAGQAQTLLQDRPDAPVPLDGDPVRLAQVFGNLLSNAAKYSHRGGTVALTVAVQGGRVTVTVRDDGIGIEPDMLERVFEMFSQSSQAIGRAQGGLGIGLALVKGLVELHGGRVEAHSAGLGHGSRFVVELPLAAQAAGAAAGGGPAPAAPGAGGRVLVVDDNRDGADALALLLAADGYDVRTAYDGASAVAEAERFRPRVVLLDLGMPGLDGFATARQLRAVHPAASMHLVAVTGWGQDRHRRAAIAAGFDAHAVKPVAPDELRQLLRKVIA